MLIMFQLFLKLYYQHGKGGKGNMLLGNVKAKSGQIREFVKLWVVVKFVRNLVNQ